MSEDLGGSAFLIAQPNQRVQNAEQAEGLHLRDNIGWQSTVLPITGEQCFDEALALFGIGFYLFSQSPYIVKKIAVGTHLKIQDGGLVGQVQKVAEVGISVDQAVGL